MYSITDRLLHIAAILALAALLGLGSWFGIGWLQEQRADGMLTSANSHVGNANGIMAQIEVGRLGSESFTSLDSISQANRAIESMIPLLEEAATEISSAREDAGTAAGFPLLDDWYRTYMDKKRETAGLRMQQLEVLAETAGRLQQLYAAGPVIFNSVQEMDRLFGQLQDALGKVQNSPAEARTSLDQVSRSFSQLQQQLDQAYAQTGFEVLPELSRTAADNAELAQLAAQLADAAGAGDQARAQQAAVSLEQKLLTTSVSGNTVDLWWQEQIDPLEQEYAELQARQEALDAEAAALYEQRGR
ncbi:MAG: hypothetical protein HZB44_04430 [Actinobacteria bacterium]|nr:hypothetical protein [Actinomycetota bacterium]